MASRGGNEKRADRRHLHILRRYWEIVNMYPRISDPALMDRIEKFTINAGCEELFRMQQAVFESGTRYLVEDPGWKRILEHLDGKSVGLAIGDEYRSTVTLKDCRFELRMGIRDIAIPVLSVASRTDYVDALLRRKDLIRMIITGRLRATHKFTLVRWGLGFFELLKDDALFDSLLQHQDVAEKVVAQTLRSMEY